MKKFARIFSFLLVSLIVFPSSNYYAAGNYGEELKIYMGDVEVVSVRNPVRIAIGNPSIADVTNVSKNDVTIAPKGVGSTTFVVWDDFGEQNYRIKVLPENLNVIRQRVDTLLAKLDLPHIYTKAEEEENKVILLGRVKTVQDRERVATILGPLKDKTVDMILVEEEEAVVEIDVQILELNQDATETIGVSWPGSISLAESLNATPLGAAGTNFSKVFRLGNVLRATSAGGVNTANPYTIVLDALIQEGKARVLSRPRLSCQSGKEAELMVGGERPILTTTISGISGGTGTEVEYKEFGIKLKIKPVVTKDRRIKIGLKTEVSEFSDTAVTIGPAAAPTALAYPLSKREASTELYLDDGEIMAIGGLIKHKTEEDVRRVPFLSKIPVLGIFFRQKQTTIGGGQGARGDTELFIILTPRIVGLTKSTAKAEAEEKGKKGPISAALEAAGNIPPLAGQNLSGQTASYATVVQKKIMDKLVYPAQAQSAGFQGTVKLSLVLSYQGEVLDAMIKESSGYNILDENAVAMAYQVAPYPPFPPSIDSEELQVDVPIVYKLR